MYIYMYIRPDTGSVYVRVYIRVAAKVTSRLCTCNAHMRELCISHARNARGSSQTFVCAAKEMATGELVKLT